MSHKVASVIPSSAVATSGTLTFAYPTGTDASTYASYGHRIIARGLQAKFTQDAGQISVSFGASNITVTYKGTTSIPADSVVLAEFNVSGNEDAPIMPASVYDMSLVKIDLGAPDTIDDDGICQSQSASGAHTLTLNGALVVNGVAVLDVPRNVIADSGGADTAVLTITGTDVYGNVMKESITLNGATAVPGKKAFKTITSVTSSATISNGAFLGTGDVLGLPCFLPSTGMVLKELQDGAAATAGTLVAGVQTTPTATTGDVRGTYDPNAACDGSKAFVLIAALADPDYKGVDQYDG